MNELNQYNNTTVQANDDFWLADGLKARQFIQKDTVWRISVTDYTGLGCLINLTDAKTNQTTKFASLGLNKQFLNWFNQYFEIQN